MKNTNYNVLKLLHIELDNLWRIERYYLKDSKLAKCKCPKLLAMMRRDYKKHIQALKKELGLHWKMSKLD